MIVWTAELEAIAARGVRVTGEARAELEEVAVRLARDTSGAFVGSKRDLAFLVVELGAELEAVRAALRDVAEWVPALKPAGHTGDEESAQCDPDCARCTYEAIEARIDAATGDR